MRNWSYGRSEARKILIGGVLFLIEKIKSYSSIAEAKNDGYEIMLPEAGSDEMNVPLDITGTIWDIPLAETKGGTEEDLAARNWQLMKDMEKRFPSLHVVLRYNRAVVRFAYTAASLTPPPFWPTEERVCLHELALTILTSSLSAKSNSAVCRCLAFHCALCMSSRSVCAVLFARARLERGSLREVQI